MSPAQLEACLPLYCRCRPFRSFLIEFTSGGQAVISHPEVVRAQGAQGDLYVLRHRDGGYTVFPAESVARLLDLPVDSK